MKRIIYLAALVFGSNFFFAGTVLANTAYEVSITNLTRGQIFSPVLLLSHNKRFQLFKLGEEASAGLALLAEQGDSLILTNELIGSDYVHEVVNDVEAIPPGGTRTLTIHIGRGGKKYISVGAMMVSTNDAFYALNGVRVPANGSATYLVPGYDAGSEGNDELCENIPGPCDDEPGSADKPEGEGVVHVQGGIHGIGGLNAALRDWRNPVASISIKKMKQE